MLKFKKKSKLCRLVLYNYGILDVASFIKGLLSALNGINV